MKLIDSMESFDGMQVEIYEIENTGLCVPNFNESETDLFPIWLTGFLGTYERLTDYLYKFGFRW